MTNMLTYNNKKMKASSNDKRFYVSFGLPVVKTCPFADLCKAECYASAGPMMYTNVVAHYESNYQRSLNIEQFKTDMNSEIVKLESKHNKHGRTVYVRIHDCGDFYAPSYLKAWIDIAVMHPATVFYAYTKSVRMVKQVTLPMNLRIVFSLGGKEDKYIEASDRVCMVGDKLKEGWDDASDNEWLASDGMSKRIWVKYHNARYRDFNKSAWKNLIVPEILN